MSAPVAIVIPCYRHAHFVAEAVRSSLDQDPPPAEIVVVDDGSPDEVAAALATVGQQPTVRLDADDRLLPAQRWLGLSEQARRFDKWIVCRVHAAARSGWLKYA